MDGRVTLGAFGQGRRLQAVSAGNVGAVGSLRRREGTIDAIDCGVKVHRVTVQAQGRLALGQEIVSHRTVGRVAETAILIDRRVLIHERTFLVGMTTETEFTTGPIHGVGRLATVNAVTIRTYHLTLSYRVMRGHKGRCSDVAVAFVANIWFSLDGRLLARLMDLVTRSTVDAGRLMRGESPVVELTTRVTTRTDSLRAKLIRPGRIDNQLRITIPLNMFDSISVATGAVAVGRPAILKLSSVRSLIKRLHDVIVTIDANAARWAFGSRRCHPHESCQPQRYPQ